VPGASYAVTLRGPNVSGSDILVADAEGRLHIEGPLGPRNPYQEDAVEATVAGTAVCTTHVSIAKAST